MRTNLSIAKAGLARLLTAALALAITLTFSCSSGGNGDDDGSGGGNGQGGGVPFNEKSRVYNGHYDEDYVLHIDGEYNGNGVIKIPAYDEQWNETLINAGSVINGIVNLDLPTPAIFTEYLSTFYADKIQSSCSKYTEGIKEFGGEFVLTNSNGDYELIAYYGDEQVVDVFQYVYFSKAGKITCDYEKDTGRSIIDMNIQIGWNKIYCHNSYAGGRTKKCSTDNILTKEVKWVISTN